MTDLSCSNTATCFFWSNTLTVAVAAVIPCTASDSLLSLFLFVIVSGGLQKCRFCTSLIIQVV